MKFSYEWLRELSGTEKSPKELAELIMFHAFEVESVEPFPHGLDSVVVGRVETVARHPDADRLSVTTVSVTEDGEPRTVVCGAPNVAAGQKVAVALPGAKLPNGMEIADAKIRGVASSGMICAEDELGLGVGHEGILVLPDDAPTGTPLSEYLRLDDTTLDVNILPNRGCDALSYRGLAREIAALEGRNPSFNEASAMPSASAFDVSVSVVSERCRRYVGILLESVGDAPTPLPIRSALIRSGLRPLGLAVDITNYLMLLFGQPMHAFDADVLEGGVVVRQAEEGEKLTLLDGTELSLSKEDLVIADGKRALALAGVMGGSLSGISADTKRVFLEIASFDPASIRKTVARHRIPTDASYRFERDVDTGRADGAATEAIRLFSEVAGATVAGLSDTVVRADAPTAVRFDPKVFSEMFGDGIDMETAKGKLSALGLAPSADGEGWKVTVPTYRPDLRDAWDLAEEVGRMIGYDAFPAEAPKLPLVSPRVEPELVFARSLKRFLADAGWDEMLTYPFYSEDDAKRLGGTFPDRHLRLANPMNPDQAMLRGSLLPSAIRKVAENRRYLGSFRFFELGDRFLVGADGQPAEERVLSLVLSDPKDGSSGFTAFKGAVGKLLAFAKIGEAVWEELPEGETEGEAALFHPTRSARILAGGNPIGLAGEISPIIREAYGIRQPVFAAVFSFGSLVVPYGQVGVYRPLPKFPSATRDLSLSVEGNVRAGELSAAIASADPLIREVSLFDIYEKDDGKKNLAFHISFGRDDRTVTGKEVDVAMERIVSVAVESFGAEHTS